MKTPTLAAISCAAVFALAGCSDGQEDDPPPTSVTESPAAEPTDDSPGDPTDEPTDGSTGDPTEPASEGLDGAEYTPDELEAALADLNETRSLAGVIVPDAEIRRLLGEAGGEGQVRDLVVTPEECNVFADTDITEQAADANLAVMTFAGGSSLQPDSISLASQASSEVIQDQIDANRTQLQQCSEFEMEIEGQVVSATVTELSATTDAEETIAVRTVVQVPGTIQETVSVTGVTGMTNISVTVGSSGDAEVDLERGMDLVNGAIAALQNP